MTEQHPVIERYLARLAEALGGLPAADRQEVLGDIRSHLAEAVAAGMPLDAAIEKLGPAEELARAYAVELLVNPRQPADRGSAVGRFLKVVGLVAVASIPTLVIVAVLGSLGLSFSLAGIAVFGSGLLAAAGHLPPWLHMDAPPVFAIAGGPAMSAFGVLCLIGLWFYVKWLARAVRAVVPRD